MSSRPAPAVRRPSPVRRPAQKKPAPPLEIVAPRRRRRRVIAFAGLGSLVVFAIMLALAAFQTKIASGQLQLDRVEAETRQAQLRYQQLRLQVAELEAPERIVTAAKELGMVQPEALDYVGVTSDQVAAVVAAQGAGPAAPIDPAATPQTGWSTVKPLVGATP